jgi:hypothetical protein
MKLQAPVTSAFPAALAVGSMALSLLLLPGGGASIHSSGVAPALKLVAGEVVAAVQSPPHAVTRAKPNSIAAPATAAAGSPVSAQSPSSSAGTDTLPAHRAAHQRPVHQRRASHTHAVAPAPAARPLAPAPTSSLPKHGGGKAKALGHLHKVVPVPIPVDEPAVIAQPKAGHGKGHGQPTAVPNVPPAVPPGQAAGGQAANEHGNSGGRGGGGK